MLTATRKKTRTVNVSTMSNGKRVLWLTVDGKTRAYTLTEETVKNGILYRLGKADNGDGHMEDYTVYVATGCGKHSCDCKGWSFRGSCKHQSAVLALRAAGKI